MKHQEVSAETQDQQKESQPNPNYLGTAKQTFPDEPKFLLSLIAEKIKAIEADQYGKIKMDLVEFSKDDNISYGVYLHDDNRKMSNVSLILQIDKEKALSFVNEKGYIPLTTNNKNPENIKADKMNIVVYVNKYSEEMKDWQKEERNNALRPNTDDYVGGGWKIDRAYHKEKEIKGKKPILKDKEEEKPETTQKKIKK